MDDDRLGAESVSQAIERPGPGLERLDSPVGTELRHGEAGEGFGSIREEDRKSVV